MSHSLYKCRPYARVHARVTAADRSRARETLKCLRVVEAAPAERGVLFTYSCSYSLRDFARVRRQVRPRPVHVTEDQARVEAIDHDVFRDLRRAAVKQRTSRCFRMAEVERCQDADRHRHHEAAAVYMRHIHTRGFRFPFPSSRGFRFFLPFFRVPFLVCVLSLVVWGLM